MLLGELLMYGYLYIGTCTICWHCFRYNRYLKAKCTNGVNCNEAIGQNDHLFIVKSILRHTVCTIYVGHCDSWNGSEINFTAHIDYPVGASFVYRAFFPPSLLLEQCRFVTC